MSTNSVDNSFFVENLFWVKGNEKSEKAVRLIEKAVCELDPIRRLEFSFTQAPVYDNEGGTVGLRPAFRVSGVCPDMDTYKKNIENELGNPEIMAPIGALSPFEQQFTHMFYRIVHQATHAESSLSLIDVLEKLTDEEKKLVHKEQEKMATRPDTIKVEDHDFCVLYHTGATINTQDGFKLDVGALGKPFVVQNTFLAKPGFETIAQKVITYVCEHIEQNRTLMFPFHVDPVVDGKGGTMGEMPTYTIIRTYNNAEEYKATVKFEMHDSAFLSAMKILGACAKSFSRQFWLHEMN